MSGSTIGGVVGGAIGFVVSGYNPQGFQVGWLVGSAVSSYVDPDVIKGQRLNDAQVQTSMEGAPRWLIYGTNAGSGNVIMSGPLVEHKHSDRTGKGGPVQESYSYTRTYAIRVCEAPMQADGTTRIGGITRIWEDDKLVYDKRNPADWPNAAADIAAMAADTAKFATGIVIYDGSETQLPDATLEALPAANGGGVGNVNAHRGSSLVVFINRDLTQRQGTIPQYRFEVASCAESVAIDGDELPGWRHGYTGTGQSIFDIAMSDLAIMVSGWNDNLRRSTDGTTWDAVDYLSDTGWSSSDPIWNIWYDPGLDIWFMATSTEIAYSEDQGRNWGIYGSPVYDIGERTVASLGGSWWAGATDTANTTIFQVLIPVAPLETDYGSHGDVSALASLNGGTFVGTVTGKILNGVDNVVYTSPDSSPIRCFSYGNGVYLAGLSGGYAHSSDGVNWVFVSGASAFGFVYTNDLHYMATAERIYSSPDAITWTEVDDYFLGNGLGSHLTFYGSTVFAASQAGLTTVSPLIFPLPDLPNAYYDLNGNIFMPATTALSTCHAALDETVIDLCARVGVIASQLDVSQLTDEIRGFIVGQQMPCASAIRSLQRGFNFDFPEWGDYTDTATKLRGIKRGGAALFALDEDDLVDSDDDEGVRAQAVEFPLKLNLVSADVDADYNPTVQAVSRSTSNVKAVGETTIELPFAMTRAEAAPVAAIMHKVAWTEAEGRWKRELPEEFTQLTPSDPFTFDGKRWRAERVEYLDGTVKVDAVRDRASAYTSTATPGDSLTPTPPVLTVRGPTMFAAMNLPRLRSADSVPGMYVAACGLLDGWLGADLQLSVDGGLTYQSVLSMTNEAVIGLLTDTATESGEPITVKVFPHGELDSITGEQIAARLNAFAITTNAVSEVGQFQTADETVTDHEYELTDNIRGQLGTTAAVHDIGDKFVLLDGAVYFLPLDSSLTGQTLIFRPVSLGTAAANNQTYSVVFLPQFTGPETITYLQTNTGDPITANDGSYIQVTTA